MGICLTPLCVKNLTISVEGLAGVLAIVVSPDGKHAYTGGYRDYTIAVFNRDAVTGRLSFVEAQKDNVGGVSGIARIRAVTISKDGRHVYAAGCNNRLSKKFGSKVLDIGGVSEV